MKYCVTAGGASNIREISEVNPAELNQVIAEIEALNQEIESLSLTDYHMAKPLIHVNELSELYEKEKLGRLTEPFLNELISF